MPDPSPCAAPRHCVRSRLGGPAAALLCLWLAACSAPPPETAIRAAVDRIDAALSEHDNSAVRAELAESFRGGPADEAGQLDKAGVQRLLAGYFLRYRNIHVVISGLTVEPLAHDPSQAWSDAKVVLAGAEGLIPETGRVYSVRGLWQLRDDQWQLVQLRWE